MAIRDADVAEEVARFLVPNPRTSRFAATSSGARRRSRSSEACRAAEARSAREGTDASEHVGAARVREAGLPPSASWMRRFEPSINTGRTLSTDRKPIRALAPAVKMQNVNSSNSFSREAVRPTWANSDSLARISRRFWW